MARIGEAISLRRVTDKKELAELNSELHRKATEKNVDVTGCYISAQRDDEMHTVEGSPVKVKLLRIVGETNSAVVSSELAVLVEADGGVYTHWESFM